MKAKTVPADEALRRSAGTITQPDKRAVVDRTNNANGEYAERRRIKVVERVN